MILEQNDEEHQWNLYCAVSANAFAGDIGTFDEFRYKLNHPQRKEMDKTEQSEPSMNKSQIMLQVEKSKKLLSGFVPPMKGGG